MYNSRLVNTNFYPRSPCGERHTSCIIVGLRILISIHALLAESDYVMYNSRLANTNFYPRSPCGERLAIGLSTKSISNFYPRSPCGERRGLLTLQNLLQQFLSTLSLRRATHNAGPLQAGYKDFYPRSPCGERRAAAGKRAGRYYFYPRSPCGERPYGRINDISRLIFLSTLSLRRAT